MRRLLAHRELAVALILAITVIAVSIINHDFLSLGNFRDILIKVAPSAIVGCGLTFVILTGEIDISVGSLMGFLAVLLGLLTSPDYAHLPVSLSILIVLAAGTFIGFINGLLITFGRVPSIIMTLGMLTALRGATKVLIRVYANDRWIGNLPDTLRFLGTGSILGVPVSVLTALIILILCALAAAYTPLGRRIYAVGSNTHAATLAGLSPNRIKLFAFTLTGFLTAIATMVSVPQLSVIDSDIGVGFELLVVTAVVVGGTSISGGKGTILGTLLGVILLGTVRTVLTFLKLGTDATYWERAIQGGFILLAVLADQLAKRDRSEDE
jgi:ribose/xylose/arabinose/galactoside ABC-type transport system permease subunit